MTLPRSARFAVGLGLLLAATLTASSPAADPAPKWEVARTSAPEDLAELKALQATVKAVTDKCTPATVAIQYGDGFGSGVIVSEDGLVLTAAHVVRQYGAAKKGKRGRLEPEELPYTAGKTVRVMLPDGTKVDGKTLGVNGGRDAAFESGLDSAMIQITSKGPIDGKWPCVAVGKSGDMHKGQWVVGLGHPNGPKQDRPPVARLGRVLKNDKEGLRTDCTIVSGDSGGPLFDLNGKVVGIHSRMEYVGFAWNIHVYADGKNLHAPLDQFHKNWDKLLAGEWVDKPAAVARASTAYIGVVFPDDEEDDAWLKEVEDEGPGALGGLKPGDTITKFNDTAVKSVRAFRKLMETAKPGDKVKLTVRRGTTMTPLTVTLTKRA